MPLRRTKRIPLKAARSRTGGRPPFGLRRRFGSGGAIRAHNPSPTNAAAKCRFYSALGRCERRPLCVCARLEGRLSVGRVLAAGARVDEALEPNGRDISIESR